MIKLYNYLVKNGDAVAVGVSAILFVIFALGIYVDLFKNFKSGSKSIFGFLAIVIAFIVLYFTSSHDSGGRFGAYWSPEFGITEGLSKFISAGLYSLMGLTLVSFLLILFYEVKSFFR